MSINVRTFHSCDVCKKTKETKDKPDEWEFIYYGQTWQSGSHRGAVDRKFLACDECLNGKNGFFGFLLKLWNPKKAQ